MRRHLAPPLIAATASLSLLLGGLAGCSDDGPKPSCCAEPQAKPRIALDPKHYVDDYESSMEDAYASTTGTASPSAQADSSGGAAPTTSRSGGDVLPPEEPGFLDDNTFRGNGRSPFVATRDDPRSTFGLDVDTGSFTIGRTFLDEGYRPDPASVRTEEWVNALGYGDEPPTDGDLAVRVSGAPAPGTSDGTQLLRVAIKGREVAKADRPPVNLTFVVDTSGSMDIRERLGLVKASLGLLVLSLNDGDTISIVTFEDQSSVLLPPTPVDEPRKIVDAIDALQPGGSTNLEAGLRTGYDEAAKGFRKGGINTVILASDGVANVGDTGPGSLAEEIQRRAEGGIHLVTVGYGMGNYNDELMEQVADRGDGFYAYLDTYAEAQRFFGDQLTSVLTPIADDAKVQVRFDPEVVGSYRLLGYEDRAIADDQFTDDSVDAGELGAGHAVSALYEVRPADGVDLRDATLGSVSLRSRSVASGEVVAQAAPIRGADLADSFDAAPTSLRLAGTAAEVAEVFAQAPSMTERKVTLDQLAAQVRAVIRDGAPSDGTDGKATAQDLLDLIERAHSASTPVTPPDDGPVPPTVPTTRPTTVPSTVAPAPAPTTTEPELGPDGPVIVD